MSVKSGKFYCASGTGKFAEELVLLGNEVTMFGQQIEDPTSTSSFDILEGGIKVAGTRRYKSKIISYLLLYCLSIKHIMKSDFIYLFYPTSYRYLPFICLILCKKYGLYVRGEEKINNRLSKLLYRKAFVVFTVAQCFTDMVNNINKKCIAHTIRPMISYTHNDVILNREYVTKDKYNILFLSRLQKEKGIEELLMAIKELKETGKQNFHLYVIGGGSYLEAAKIFIKEHGLENYVSLEGAIDDEKKKKEYFLNSDIYILPTYNEGFPRTLYEAMIFGTPIITTFVGGIPALMKQKENCLKIETHSTASIVETISYALSHYNSMATLAMNATQTVLKVIDPKRLSHAQDVNLVIHRKNQI